MAFTRNIPSRTRVGGSAFTIFLWQSDPIGFARQIGHVSPTPVGPGPTPIHPLDEPYPVEIITPAAQNIGTLTLELYELYNQKVWDNLKGLSGYVDLVNIFIAVAAMGRGVQMAKVIRPPNLGQSGSTDQSTIVSNAPRPYTEYFHNCVITNVEDGETIEVGTMEISKRITVAYTSITRDGAKSNLATALSQRDTTSGVS